MAGTENTTKSLSKTNDQTIDGILGRAWGNNTIYYSFPISSSIYDYDDGKQDTFYSVTSAQKKAAHFALNADASPSASSGFSVEGFTNLDVRINGDAGYNDHIRFGNTSYSQEYTASAYYPSTRAAGGDVWFGDASYNYKQPEAGSYAWHTMLHEIGHALGLSHGHQSRFGFGALPSQYDKMEYSVMSYRSFEGENYQGYFNESSSYAQTYMIGDIAALQHMYGADFTTNSGNTVYSWKPGSGETVINGQVAISPVGNRIFATIWDGGGEDTYDLSAYSNSLDINLAPGQSSSFNNAQTATLADSYGMYAKAEGNIYNARQYQGDVRSLIENAIGGSGSDTIIGNAAANKLWGKGGNDILLGGNGRDRLYGGDGDDYLDTGKGSGWQYSYGHDGSDTYNMHSSAKKVFVSSYGEALSNGDQDKVIFADLAFDEASFRTHDYTDSWASQGVALSVLGKGAEFRFAQMGHAIEEFHFTDGTVINEFHLGVSGVGGRDRLHGSDGADYLDTGVGYGNWQYSYGYDGSDIYNMHSSAKKVFVSSYGEALSNGDQDKVIFADLAFDEASFRTHDYTDSWANQGVALSVLGKGAEFRFAQMGHAIEEFHFADGTVINDFHIGDSGNDILEGNLGVDHFVFARGGDADSVSGFQNNIDSIGLYGFDFATANDAMSFASQQGNDVIFDFGQGDTLHVQNIGLNTLQDDIFVA